MSSEHTLLIERVATVLAQPQAVAAEAQGMLCGLICALGEKVSPRGWRDQVLEGHQGVAPGQEQVLQSLFETTRKEFFSEDLSFQPLLPGDGVALEQRAEALGHWCEGFLLGLGLGGVSRTERLPASAREALTDMGEIARLDFDTGDGDEEQESAYAELVEYVRMGALLVYDELADVRRRAAAKTH